MLDPIKGGVPFPPVEKCPTCGMEPDKRNITRALRRSDAYHRRMLHLALQEVAWLTRFMREDRNRYEHEIRLLRGDKP